MRSSIKNMDSSSFLTTPGRKAALQIAATALLSMAVAGCAGGFASGIGAQFPVTQETPAGQSLITFEDPAFKAAKTARVSHLDAFEHVEYARFETADLTLEAVYDIALGDGYVLEYDYWMKRMVNTWNINHGKAGSWGSRKTERTFYGTIDYQSYRLAGTGQSCVGFNSSWDYQPRDPFGRPTKVLFGYVCAKPGQNLSEQRVAALLKTVVVSKRPGESFVPTNPRRSVDQVAFNTAKGSTGSTGGNAEFPFNFGTPYFGEDGSSFGN